MLESLDQQDWSPVNRRMEPDQEKEEREKQEAEAKAKERRGG